MRHLLVIATMAVATVAAMAPLSALFTGNSDAFLDGSPVMVPVCWTAPNDQDLNDVAARREVQDAVESEWQRFARVNFTYFEPCWEVPSGRRIEVTLRPGQSSGQCPWTADPKATKQCWIGIACVRGGNASCIRGVALHEFGHALGYYHQEERLDYDHAQFWGDAMPSRNCESQNWCDPNNPNPETCPKQRKFGGYDPSSIMSYCQPGSSLSANDILAHQHVYGFRKPNAIMSRRGDCLSVDPSIAETAFAGDCDEGPNQKWRRDLDGRIWSLRDKSICLGVDDSRTNGAAVQAVNCESVNTRWAIVRGEVRGFAGKCVALRDGATKSGTAVVIAECDESVSQQWSISRAGELMFRSRSSNKCVYVKNGRNARSDTLALAECDGSRGQRFTFANNRIKFEGRCVDVPATPDADYWPDGSVGTSTNRHVPTDGAQLQLRNCRPQQFNQKFWVSASLRANGRCLDLDQSGPSNGARIQTWDCLNSDNQRWDIFF